MDNIKILCLETSSQFCSVAIINGQIITQIKSEEVQNHAEVLLGMIQDCCLQATVSLSDLNAIAVSDGPGSYTGLRIGSSTAKGLCFALNIPLIAVSTLKALAWDALRHSDTDLIWPMIDARRMEVYHSVFNRQLDVISEATNGIITDADFVPECIQTSSVLICGDGAIKTEGLLSYPIYTQLPEAEFLCRLALESYQRRQFASVSAYEPFYLKGANITR